MKTRSRKTLISKNSYVLELNFGTFGWKDAIYFTADKDIKEELKRQLVKMQK